MKRIIIALLLTSALFAAEVSFRIGNSQISAQLRGITGTRTAGQTITSTFNQYTRLHVFDVTVSGEYYLYIDPAGGSTYARVTNWPGEGSYIVGDDIQTAIAAEDSIIALSNLTTAAYNYIGSGGSVTNNPDDVSLYNSGGSVISIKDAYFFTNDTTTLKTTTSPNYKLLTSLSSTNPYGGGWFVQKDSLLPEGYGIAFDHDSSGQQWVRTEYLETNELNPIWMGAVPDDTTSAQIAINDSVFARIGRNTFCGSLFLPGLFYTSKTFWITETSKIRRIWGHRMYLSGISCIDTLQHVIMVGDSSNLDAPNAGNGATNMTWFDFDNFEISHAEKSEAAGSNMGVGYFGEGNTGIRDGLVFFPQVSKSRFSNLVFGGCGAGIRFVRLVNDSRFERLRIGYCTYGFASGVENDTYMRAATDYPVNTGHANILIDDIQISQTQEGIHIERGGADWTIRKVAASIRVREVDRLWRGHLIYMVGVRNVIIENVDSELSEIPGNASKNASLFYFYGTTSRITIRNVRVEKVSRPTWDTTYAGDVFYFMMAKYLQGTNITIHDVYTSYETGSSSANDSSFAFLYVEAKDDSASVVDQDITVYYSGVSRPKGTNEPAFPYNYNSSNRWVPYIYNPDNIPVRNLDVLYERADSLFVWHIDTTKFLHYAYRDSVILLFKRLSKVFFCGIDNKPTGNQISHVVPCLAFQLV
nr:hypothetical protein 2 [Desulfobacterales bacterium]